MVAQPLRASRFPTSRAAKRFSLRTVIGTTCMCTRSSADVHPETGRACGRKRTSGSRALRYERRRGQVSCRAVPSASRPASVRRQRPDGHRGRRAGGRGAGQGSRRRPLPGPYAERQGSRPVVVQIASERGRGRTRVVRQQFFHRVFHSFWGWPFPSPCSCGLDHCAIRSGTRPPLSMEEAGRLRGNSDDRIQTRRRVGRLARVRGQALAAGKIDRHGDARQRFGRTLRSSRGRRTLARPAAHSGNARRG